MIVGEHEAAEFIHGYTQVMSEIFTTTPRKTKLKLLDVLARGRTEYLSDRALLDDALHRLNARSVAIAPEVVSAIRTLEVKQWLYLKDTATYSVFFDPSAKAAYAVLGLTQRLRDIIGGSGAVIETGMVRYHGHCVSDCIFSNIAWLGPNYRKDLNQVLTNIRAQGRFYKSYAS